MGLHVSNAPHVFAKETTRTLMLDVILALLPTTLAGAFIFGLRALLHVGIAIAAAVLGEYAYQKLTHKPVQIADLSAAVTGMLVGLNMPVNAPLWIPLIGSFAAIVLAKELFGGIGDNFMNPALTARAILMVSWPLALTSYTLPVFSLGLHADAVSSATVLGGLEATPLQMFLGFIPGAIGEVSKAAILIGFLYLLLRGVISWRIPVIYVGSYALLALALGNDALAGVLSGGMLFGAIFMATDYTTSPMTHKGQALYAIGCGLLTCLIRNFGAYPEGVTFAILLMNIATPLIDKYVKGGKVYGKGKK
ncbi:MAG: RnfABCDGE type electron transport complex subunit D [Candidatus Pelethousia sp.]|nr:RnfABCDGE type electron transport complex subunit D [Candidatus Pelethousia sp.]